MDSQNTFHTPTMYWILRAEHLALLTLCTALIFIHWSEINWLRGLVAFGIIDIIGYIPGAIAYRRYRGGDIPAIYHHLYNFMHTYLVWGLAIGIWWFVSGFEWAMLAVPVHLSIDRGVFGNVLKPTVLSFEPVGAAPMDVVAAALGRSNHGAKE